MRGLGWAVRGERSRPGAGEPPTVRCQIRRLGRAAGSVQGRFQALQAVRSGGWRSRDPSHRGPDRAAAAGARGAGLRAIPPGGSLRGRSDVARVGRLGPTTASGAAQLGQGRAAFIDRSAAGAAPAAQGRFVGQGRAAGARQVRGDARGRAVARRGARQPAQHHHRNTIEQQGIAGIGRRVQAHLPRGQGGASGPRTSTAAALSGAAATA